MGWMLLRAMGLVVGLLGLSPGPSGAGVTARLELDPEKSFVRDGSGLTRPLAGELRLRLGAVPPAATPVAVDVVGVSVQDGEARVLGDARFATPGRGVVGESGDLRLPTLQLQLEDADGTRLLAATDVSGTLLRQGDDVHLAAGFRFDPGEGAPFEVEVVAMSEPGAVGAQGVVPALVAALWLVRRRLPGRQVPREPGATAPARGDSGCW